MRAMSYLLLAISAALSVLACRYWVQQLMPWMRSRQMSGDLADVEWIDWPGFIGLLLPRKARRVWNALVLCAVVLILGTPHLLVLWYFFQPSDINPWLYAHYMWTLVYWLVHLGLPAMLFVRHQLSRETHSAA